MASSGSAPRARATATAAKRTSPSSRAPGSARSSPSPRRACGGPGGVGRRSRRRRRAAGPSSPMPGRWRPAGRSWKIPCSARSARLRRSQRSHDAGRRLGRRVTVDVGVTADELVGLAARDGAPGRRRPPPPQLGEEHGLEEQVAELVGRPSPPRATASAISMASSIVCGDDRLGGLHAVPGAPAPQAQPHLRERRHLGADRAGPQGVAARHGFGIRQRPGDAVGLGVGRPPRRPRGGPAQVERLGRAGQGRRQRGVERGRQHPSARRRARPAPPPGRPRARPARGR